MAIDSEDLAKHQEWLASMRSQDKRNARVTAFLGFVLYLSTRFSSHHAIADLGMFMAAAGVGAWLAINEEEKRN